MEAETLGPEEKRRAASFCCLDDARQRSVVCQSVLVFVLLRWPQIYFRGKRSWERLLVPSRRQTFALCSSLWRENNTSMNLTIATRHVGLLARVCLLRRFVSFLLTSRAHQASVLTRHFTLCTHFLINNQKQSLKLICWTDSLVITSLLVAPFPKSAFRRCNDHFLRWCHESSENWSKNTKYPRRCSGLTVLIRFGTESKKKKKKLLVSNLKKNKKIFLSEAEKWFKLESEQTLRAPTDSLLIGVKSPLVFGH